MWRMENMRVGVRYKPFYRTQLVFGEGETFVTGSLYSPYRLCKRARLDKGNRERGDVRSMAGEKHEQAFGEEVKQAAEGEREMQIDTDLADLRHGIETDVEQEEDYEARKKPLTAEELINAVKEQAAKSPDTLVESSDEAEPERHVWADEQTAAQVTMKIALDDRFEHVEDDGQEGREWFELVAQPGYCLRYDWSDLYGNQPGTLQIVRAEGPTGEEVPVVASYGLEDGAGLADVLDRACTDAARDRAEA